jgi:hypothetical protein
MIHLIMWFASLIFEPFPLHRLRKGYVLNAGPHSVLHGVIRTTYSGAGLLSLFLLCCLLTYLKGMW